MHIINPQFPLANTHANSTHKYTFMHVAKLSQYFGTEVLTKNGDLLEERLIHLPLSDGATHEDPPVGVPVYGPQLHSCLGLYAHIERN